VTIKMPDGEKTLKEKEQLQRKRVTTEKAKERGRETDSK
jgi:hypothetical protein